MIFFFFLEVKTNITEKALPHPLSLPPCDCTGSQQFTLRVGLQSLTSSPSSAMSKCMSLGNLFDRSVPQFPPRSGDDLIAPVSLSHCWIKWLNICEAQWLIYPS